MIRTLIAIAGATALLWPTAAVPLSCRRLEQWERWTLEVEEVTLDGAIQTLPTAGAFELYVAEPQSASLSGKLYDPRMPAQPRSLTVVRE